MAKQLRNYDPAVMEGASVDVSSNMSSVNDTNGNESLIVTATTSAVNELTLINSATGDAVQLNATGDDTNVGLDISSKGTGSLTLWTGGRAREGLIIVNTASAVNELTITPSATGNAVKLAATGGDTNVGLNLSSKGTGATTLWTGNGAREVLIGLDTASAVNEVTITPSATGNAVGIAASGGDTNVPLTLDGKGTGYVGVGMASTSGGLRHKRSVLASSGNTTMTSAMSGSIMLLDGAGVDYTLPAIGAGDVGMEFWFVTTVTATDQTITAASGDLLTGGAIIMSTAAGVENDAFSPDVTDDLIISMNGTTTGGIIGTTIHVIAISATRWYVDATMIGSGTITTPFS